MSHAEDCEDIISKEVIAKKERSSCSEYKNVALRTEKRYESYLLNTDVCEQRIFMFFYDLLNVCEISRI